MHKGKVLILRKIYLKGKFGIFFHSNPKTDYSIEFPTP